LQCYCDFLKKEHKKEEFDSLTKVTFQTFNKIGEDHYTFKKNVSKEVSLCKAYTKDLLKSKIMGQSVAFFIIAVN